MTKKNKLAKTVKHIKSNESDKLDELDKSVKTIKSIDSLLFKGDHKEIKNNLINEINKIANYCDTVIGEGYYGKVTLSAYGSNFQIKIGNELVTLPIVIKEAKYSGSFSISKIQNDLIIHCSEGITCEAIILYILSKSWYNGENIHMPLLLGIGRCNKNDGSFGISHMILERCGLSERINIKKTKFIGSPSNLAFGENQQLLSFISNVGGLVDYLTFNMQNKMMCTLPNGEKIYVPEIIDNICIFYLHTTHFLWEKYKLTLGDQSSGNIFIHWINEESRCGKIKLNNLKQINYQINYHNDNKKKGQFIRINTNGMIFKIGDVGISVMNPQNNVMLVGNLTNEENLEYIARYKHKCYSYWDFIFDVLRYIPMNVMTSTIIYKIIQKYDISTKYIPFVGVHERHIESMPSELEILNDALYDKMKIKNISNDMDDSGTFTNYLI